MRKYSFYFYLTLFLFVLFSLSVTSVYRFKGLMANALNPLLGYLSKSVDSDKEEIARLQLQNLLLEEKVFEFEKLIESVSDLKKEIVEEIRLLPAKVIFRSPSLWESLLWINVGELDNERLGEKIVSKNSPVILGDSLVGVVEEVQKAQSLVRLITDDSLSPSVRVLREDDGKKLYLAKGEIHGTGYPLWRSKGKRLIGVGFNYDFSDEQGEAKDLRSSNPSLIQVGDLLITTGLDGVFPKGLHVGKVTSVETLKEGDYFYNIEAEPTIKNLDEITFLFVIPPVRQINQL